MTLVGPNGAPITNGHHKLTEADVEMRLRDIDRSEASLALTIEQHREAIAELEFAIEDAGWTRVGSQGVFEFSREGLDRIVRLARLMFLKNPLIRRAIMVQSYYVFGQGVQISARDEGVNQVIQDFWDANRDILAAHDAQEANEQALQYDGNLFVALFTSRTTGAIKVRFIDFPEVRDVICNPEDRDEPWYYYRRWRQREWDAERGINAETAEHEAYYPDRRIFFEGPGGKGHPSTIGGKPVRTDVAIYHMKVGGLRHMTFGIPDVYAALDWARAYKTFLENTASLMDSLSRFAWKVTAKGSKINAAKNKLATTLNPDTDDTNPAPTTGSVFFGARDETDITAIPKTGAVISPDDGKALRTMVASATDIPDTILSGDPDMGNLATAKTLDRPTELAMRSRQMLWQDALRDICAFVVECNVRANVLPTIADSTVPGGVVIGQDADGNEIDTSIDVNFPPVLEQDREKILKGIVDAITLMGNAPAGLIENKLATRILLVALEQENVDETVAEMYPDTGQMTPAQQQAVAAEQTQMAAALRDFRSVVDKLRENERQP